jgi:hypothetical protein
MTGRADGVDVINFSISGTLTNFADPVEISFLFAADGHLRGRVCRQQRPDNRDVAHPAWTTTVAAGTHNRDARLRDRQQRHDTAARRSRQPSALLRS